MRSKKLKEVGLFSFFIVMVVAVIALTSYISKSVFMSITSDDTEDNTNYVLENIAEPDMPVNKEIKSVIVKPYNSTDVNVEINFYDTSSEDERKEKSLILYDNTYMPSTGILYSSENQFDVASIFQGKVEDIKEDSTLGNIITIKHNNNFISKYSCVSDITVNVGDEIDSGTIIGKSSTNKINNKENSLFVEIIHNGTYVNPDNYYDKTIEEVENN